MNGLRAAALLALVNLLLAGSAETILAAEVSRHPDRCRVLATTGKSQAGRDPESRRTCARVDNRHSPHHVRHSKNKHERPIDRLRSRGEGRPKATGDKGARRQFHKHSHARHSHARHHHWRR